MVQPDPCAPRHVLQGLPPRNADPSAPWPVHTLYGDGTEIEEEVLATIRRVVWEASAAVPMQKSCLMVVDNCRRCTEEWASKFISCLY